MPKSNRLKAASGSSSRLQLVLALLSVLLGCVSIGLALAPAREPVLLLFLTVTRTPEPGIIAEDEQGAEHRPDPQGRLVLPRRQIGKSLRILDGTSRFEITRHVVRDTARQEVEVTR